MSADKRMICARAALVALWLPAFCLGSAPVQAQQSVTRGLVITGVTIVDTRDGRLTSGRTVVLDGGRIVKIAAANEITVGGNARRIDAAGKFVVPGYLEMHAHPLMSGDPEGALMLMLASGVTGFRQMAATPALLEARRAGKLPLSAQTPELLAMPGTILTRGNAATPEAAVAEVQRQKAQGADFIKVVDIPPAAFYAALEELKKLGLPFVGHLQPNVNVTDATRAGMREIAHLGPRDSILVACSGDEDDIRRAIAQPAAPPPSPPSPQQMAMAARTIATALANPILLTPPGEFVRYQRVIDSYSESKCRQLAAHFVKENTWHAPTLIRTRTMQFGDDAGYRNDTNLRYMPVATRQMWEELAQQFPSKVPPASAATLKQLFALQLKVVKVFDQAGVKMLAGSDFGGQWIMPGFGLHQEFDLLEEAGLSPLAVLQMTTLNGAEFLGRQASMGSVGEGKDANLVLLNANPMASVQNLHAIHAVVRAGAYLSADELNAMKNAAGARHAGPK